MTTLTIKSHVQKNKTKPEVPAKRQVAAPIKISEGSAVVTIYQERTKIGSKIYPSYRIRWFESDRQLAKPKRMSNKADAIAWARAKAIQIANGQTMALQMTDADSASLVRLREIAAQYQITEPIELVLAQSCADRQILAEHGTTPEGARKFFIRHHPKGIERINFPQLVEKFLEEKSRDGTRWRQRTDLRNRLNILAKVFNGPLPDYTAKDINDVLTMLQKRHGWANRTRNHHRTALLNIINWARGPEKHIALDWTEYQFIKRYQEKDSAITVYSPEAVAILFAKATAEHIPALALMFFTACRSSEITGSIKDEIPAIDWADINLKTGELFLNPGKVRKAGQRFAHMPPNARAWLKSVWKSKGPIFAGRETLLWQQLKHFAKKIGFAWIKNGHRHSAISYRMALIRDIERVSDEVGTSITTLKRRYRRPLPRQSAVKYYKIFPKLSQKTPAETAKNPSIREPKPAKQSIKSALK